MIRVNSSTSNSKSSTHFEKVKEIVKKIVLLLLALNLVDFSIGFMLDFLRDHAPDGRYQKATYTLQKSNEDVLVLGSSKGESNFIPAVIDSSLGLTCWNASRGGQGLPYFQAVTQSVLSRHTPKLVLLNLEVDILSTPVEYEEAGFLRPYYTEVEPVRDVLNNISEMAWIYNRSRLYQYNSSFYYLLRPYLLHGLDGEIDQQGWKPRSGVITKPFKRDHLESLIDSKSLLPEAVEILESITRNYKEHGSSLCFVISPDYGEITKYSASREKILAIAKKNSIPVFDFSNKPDYASDEAIFVDIQHLNKEGALKFTSDILSQVRSAMTKNNISINALNNSNRNEGKPNTKVY